LQPVAQFGRTQLYENEHFRPRAYVAGQVEPVENLQSALERMAGDTNTGFAVVEGGPGLNSDRLDSAVAWRLRSPDHLVLEVTLDRPGLLVVSQVWYRGWQASVDDRPAKLWRANGVLSGVYLEPGQHTVRLDYRPATLWIGIALSALGMLTCALLMDTRKT
jgi:hypothetical protein